MKRANNVRIERQNRSRRKKVLKNMRKQRHHFAEINRSREENFGQNKAKPYSMQMPSSQMLKRKGSKG